MRRKMCQSFKYIVVTTFVFLLSSCQIIEDPKSETNRHIHNYVVEKGVDGNCVKTGTTNKIYCDECGYVLHDHESLGFPDVHNYMVEQGKEATCITDGETDKVFCIDCGYVLADHEVIEKTGVHDYGEWEIVTEPTYFDDGLKSKHCSVCDNEIQEIIPKKDITKCKHPNTIFQFQQESTYSENTVIEKCVYCRKELSNYSLDTDLPIVSINTESSVLNRNDYVQGSIDILKPDNTITTYGTEIRGRGNATWFYDKKPYKLKLNSKQALLGMNKNKHWALLASYCDKSLVRTAVGFEISNILDLNYTVDYRYVELIINGEYLGNYILTETVKEGSNRVDIDDEGFLIECSQYDEELEFTSDLRNVKYNFKYPDEEGTLLDNAFIYTKDFIDELESVLYADDSIAFSTDGYRKYIDVEEWAKWFLTNNIAANIDTNMYFYKKDTTDSTKLIIGPVWDFEWCFGIGWYYGSKPNPNHELYYYFDYYNRLLEDPYFVTVIQNLWTSIKDTIKDELMLFIDTKASMLDKSQELNFTKWDILNRQVSVEGVPLGSYEAEIDCLKAYLSSHIDWLNDTITSL